jgi:hypothetical protein
MFREFNRRGEAYPVWVYKPYKIDGRKKKTYKVKDGLVFNELGRVGKQVLSTDVKELRREGWKLLDELTTPVIEKPLVVEPQNNPPEPTKGDTTIEALLKGEGLNFSSFLRAHGKKHNDPKIRKEERPEYNELLEYYQDKYKDRIYKQGHDWFLRDK